MSIREKVDEYKKILDIFPNDQEKYQYLIEKAKENDSFPSELRLDNFKVNGCQSQVWLVPEEKDEKLFFQRRWCVNSFLDVCSFRENRESGGKIRKTS